MASDRSLTATQIDAGYLGTVTIRRISFRIQPGEAIAVVGPNGAGKTTLLKVLAGLLRPFSGTVDLDGRRIACLNRRELARRIAVVPQHLNVGFGLRGRDVVGLGRTPFLGFLGHMTEADKAAIEEAIDETDVRDFVDRPFAHLSGGESQRVVLAMALAQAASYLLLDEPTVHLDVGQQWKFMAKISQLRQHRGVGVVAILHDLNLAGHNFDRVVLMNEGSVIASGSPEEVLTASNVSDVFDIPSFMHRPSPDYSVLPHDPGRRTDGAA